MELKGKMMLVYNPASGRRYAEKVLSEVCTVCMRSGWAVTVYPTMKTGDAEAYVTSFGAGYDRITAMGGDGTLNQVLTGIVKAGLDVPVGYVPAGSTNDYASTHGIPADAGKAAELCCSDSVSEVDVAWLGDACIAFHAAFGAFAKVVNNTPQDIKNMMGYLAYILDGVKDVNVFRPERVRFETQDEVLEGDYIYGGLLSTTSLGGGILSFPQRIVSLSDGKFELFLIRCPRDLIELGDMMRELATGEYNGTYTTLRSVSSCTVSYEKDPVWCLDGEEHHFDSPARFTVLEKRIRLLKPLLPGTDQQN